MPLLPCQHNKTLEHSYIFSSSRGVAAVSVFMDVVMEVQAEELPFCFSVFRPGLCAFKHSDPQQGRLHFGPLSYLPRLHHPSLPPPLHPLPSPHRPHPSSEKKTRKDVRGVEPVLNRRTVFLPVTFIWRVGDGARSYWQDAGSEHEHF